MYIRLHPYTLNRPSVYVRSKKFATQMGTANGAMDTNHGKHTDMPGKTDSGSYVSGIEDGTGITMTDGDGNYEG